MELAFVLALIGTILFVVEAFVPEKSHPIHPVACAFFAGALAVFIYKFAALSFFG